MFYSSLHKGIHYFFILKFYLLLGRMHIYIQYRRIQVNEQNIHWETIFCNHLIIRIHYCVIEISAANKPIVYKKILIAPRLLGGFWLAHKTTYYHIIRILMYVYQFGAVGCSQYLDNALLKVARL